MYTSSILHVMLIIFVYGVSYKEDGVIILVYR